MYEIIVYDTSNYLDFPIGGQLTSIRNFLSYVASHHSNYCSKILLVGITTELECVGRTKKLKISNEEFDFIPVLYRDKKLNDIKKSLRMAFLRALFKYKKLIPNDKKTLHYIHTPEAYIQIRVCHPFAKTAIFSHGSFFNMATGFRFFQKNKLVAWGFELFIKWMLSTAQLLFVLDDDSLYKYLKYNKNVVKVNNSIILPEEKYDNRKIHDPARFLFVGRLAKIKRIDSIIEAIEKYNGNIQLTVVGDGEEREYIHSIVTSNKIEFTGALNPNDVKEIMKDSDVLIMNSVIEGKPMTIIEAMSYGLPVITTNVGGIAELVSFGKNAVATDGSVDDIRYAIKYILEHFEDYSRVSFELSKRFDYTTVNSSIFEIITGDDND